ncbi:hypothetical protein [Spiribacter onubensis]|uniref:Uncharacterized protein n=1 Tax=Spiribacter onubensis TaxID=3122420 RepID=A0ABV3S6W0_9GAMM
MKDSNITKLDEFADRNPEVHTEGSKQFDVWIKHHRAELPDGPGHGRALRTAELESYPTPAKPRLLRHHVEAAARSRRLAYINVTNLPAVKYGIDLRGIIKSIRAIPVGQRDRLDPVFQQCGLWADGHYHRRQFDRWEANFVSALDAIDAAEPGGRGKYKRLYGEYLRALEYHQMVLTDLHCDMLDALGGMFPE